MSPIPASLPPMPERIAAYAGGKPLHLAPLETVHALVDGRPVSFHLNMQDDPIQDCHRKGRFYEAGELRELATLLPERPVVLDIGANVGNHALFFALFCNARRVIVVEPNPLALDPLVANVLGNGLQETIQLQFLGWGLSDRDEDGYSMKAHDRNLGATRMFARTGGPLQVRLGDRAFPHARPHLVKIDVEGMEMQVLAGLPRLIRRSRPILMVEVGHQNADAFAAWVAENRYRRHLTTRVAKANDNHILLPDDAGGSPE